MESITTWLYNTLKVSNIKTVLYSCDVATLFFKIHCKAFWYPFFKIPSMIFSRRPTVAIILSIKHFQNAVYDIKRFLCIQNQLQKVASCGVLQQDCHNREGISKNSLKVPSYLSKTILKPSLQTQDVLFLFLQTEKKHPRHENVS